MSIDGHMAINTHLRLRESHNCGDPPACHAGSLEGMDGKIELPEARRWARCLSEQLQQGKTLKTNLVLGPVVVFLLGE
jgi:hypothetical protein